MIRRIMLTNWRAYEHLNLELRPGTTFVVARNGIGKSSLIEAATWALYGDAAGRPQGAVRLGAETASATVEATLHDGRNLKVTRDLPRRLPKSGRAPVSATLDDSPVPETELGMTIRDAFGGDPALLGRLTMLRGVEHLDPDASALNLQEHLCRFFGIDGLQEALTELASRDKLINKRIRDIKQVAAVSAERLGQLSDHHQQAVRLTADAQDGYERAVAAADAAARLRSQADAFAAWQLGEQARQTALTALSQEVSERFGAPAAPEELPEVLDRLETHTVSDLDALRRRRAMLAGRIEAVETALADLDRVASGECPVCRRPLTAEDASQARTGHLSELSAMRDELTGLDEIALVTALQAVRDYQRRSRQLASRDHGPAQPAIDIDTAVESLNAAQQQVEATRERLVQVQAAALAAETALNDAESDKRSHELLADQFRALAITTAARDAIDSTINILLTQTIDPLAREIAGRWKRLFGDRGSLVMNAQGDLSRQLNGEALPFGSFSTGEKMGAQLLLRLMILDAATHASFCWIDEPLEHLDPDARRQVASLLASTPSISGIRQVLVTTYEEPLVRRLVKRRGDGAHLVYVRPGGQDPFD